MNDIHVRQNSESFLHLLRARSRVYAEAVRLQVGQLLLTVALPAVSGFFGLLVPQTRPYVAALALIITIADVSWLDRSQRRKLKNAAKISEQFDCELLGIAWNKFIAGKRIDPEAIDSAARAWSKGDDNLVNWYPSEVSKAPLCLARIACQRSNLWYDSELRRRYGTLLIGCVAAMVLVLFLTGIIAGLSLVDFVTTVLTPASPMLIWAIRDCFRQREAAEALETIKSEADALWEKAATGDCTENEYTVRSREFQDAIYGRRVANPLVLPFIYPWLRPKMEADMNAGTANLLKRIGDGT